MSPTIHTVPDDIPLHPDAPDSNADQNSHPESGHSSVTSSSALISKHQRVMAAKSRSASNKEKTHDQEKSNYTKMPVAQAVHHPRSRVARNMWAAKVAEKIDTVAGSPVGSGDCTSEGSGATDSQTVCEQPSHSPTNENVNHQAATGSRGASDKPLIPSMSTTLCVDLPQKDVAGVNASSSLTNSEEVPSTSSVGSGNNPVLSNEDEVPPLETAQDSKTGSTVVQGLKADAVPTPWEETALRPVSASVQSPVGRSDIKCKKTPPGKENDKGPASKSAPVAPNRRSQRLLKRKRGETRMP